jgi:cation diffusion facilitator family transporter
MENNIESKIITRTSIKIMILNGFLAIIKVLAGIFGHSTAMISDAVNSISDVVTNLVVMISGKFSHKGRDEDHPYGHEKFDSMVSVLLGAAIIITAFEIGKSAVMILYDYYFNRIDIIHPELVALIVALVTILIKEFMFHFTRKSAKLANSPSLFAQAMDHRSDQLASAGAVIGISGSMLGIDVLEPLASIVICLFVFRVGYKIIKTGISQVVDQAADEAIVNRIKDIINSHDEIINIDELRTRQFGLKIYVDVEILVDENSSLLKAHEIAEKIHHEIEQNLPEVIHCMVHVNPGKNS